MPELVQLFVRLESATTGERFAPIGLREAIVANAIRLDANLNDTAVQVLADALGFEWKTRWRKSSPVPDDDVLALRMPLAGRDLLDVRAAENGRNRQDEAIAIWAARYGLPFTPCRKRHGPRRDPVAT